MNSRQAGRRNLPPAPVATLGELIEVARRFGRDPEFSRGGGGNASAKVDGVLYIKPSGVALATLTVADLVPLDLEPLLVLLNSGEHEADAAIPAGDPVMRAAADARLDDAGGPRPSVELLFHALISEQFILHTHPVAMNAITCNSDGAALAGRLFGERVLWVPYVNPGFPLALAIAAARRAHVERTARPAPAVTLMQNHGIIVGGESAAEIDERSGWLAETVRAAMAQAISPAGSRGADAGSDAADADPAPVGMDAARARVLADVIGSTLRGLLASADAPPAIAFDDSPLAAVFPTTPTGRKIVLGGPLTPDQIVYTRSWPLLVDVPEEMAPGEVPAIVRARLEEHRATYGTSPIVVVVTGLGIFAAGATWGEADTARHVYLDALRVAEGALSLGGVRALSDVERTFIETWEAEAYRRGVAAAR